MALKRILVATDFSEPSLAAAHLAQKIAREHEGEIKLVHAVPRATAAVIAVEPMYLPPRIAERLDIERASAGRKDLEALRDTLVRASEDATQVSTELLRGNPEEQILEHARAWSADLLVMGSRGGTVRFLFGSTSAAVSRQATCPVLVTGTHEGPFDLHRGLVAIDYSRFSEPLTSLSLRLAGPRAELELIHVAHALYGAPGSVVSSPSGAIDEAEHAYHSVQREQLAQFAQQFSDTAIAPYVSVGSAAGAIIDRAEETQPGFIAVGAHDRHGISEHVIGTTADRVLRHAPVPVLLLPAAALSHAPAEVR